jgi:hypothetical protein
MAAVARTVQCMLDTRNEHVHAALESATVSALSINKPSRINMSAFFNFARKTAHPLNDHDILLALDTSHFKPSASLSIERLQIEPHRDLGLSHLQHGLQGSV